MKIIHNKFLIIVIAIIFAAGIYFYNNPILKVAYGSSLESSTGSSVPSTASMSESEKISSDIAFLTALSSLDKIKIDSTLFTSKYFMALKNNTVKIGKWQSYYNFTFL